MVFIGGAVLANIVRRSSCLMFKLLIVLTHSRRCRTRRACGLPRRNGRSRVRVLWRSSVVEHKFYSAAIRNTRAGFTHEEDLLLEVAGIKTESHSGRPVLSTPLVTEMRYQASEEHADKVEDSRLLIRSSADLERCAPKRHGGGVNGNIWAFWTLPFSPCPPVHGQGSHY